jgi:hypothetical protein
VPRRARTNVVVGGQFARPESSLFDNATDNARLVDTRKGARHSPVTGRSCGFCTQWWQSAAAVLCGRGKNGGHNGAIKAVVVGDQLGRAAHTRDAHHSSSTGVPSWKSVRASELANGQPIVAVAASKHPTSTSGPHVRMLLHTAHCSPEPLLKKLQVRSGNPFWVRSDSVLAEFGTKCATRSVQARHGDLVCARI